MSASVLRMFNPSFLRFMFPSFVFPFSPDTSFISYLSFGIFPLFRDCRDTDVSHSGRGFCLSECMIQVFLTKLFLRR